MEAKGSGERGTEHGENIKGSLILWDIQARERERRKRDGRDRRERDGGERERRERERDGGERGERDIHTNREIPRGGKGELQLKREPVIALAPSTITLKVCAVVRQSSNLLLRSP